MQIAHSNVKDLESCCWRWKMWIKHQKKNYVHYLARPSTEKRRKEKLDNLEDKARGMEAESK